MKRKNCLEAPSMEELYCLIRWPEGSKGAQQEQNAIEGYLQLCKEVGFGRMKQIAEQVWDIWHHPEAVEGYTKEQKIHNDFLAECRKEMGL